MNITAVPSSPVTLPCSTFPDPTLSFSWQLNGTPLFPAASGGALAIGEDGGLTIANVLSSSEGAYVCSASNNLGTANGTVYLNVLGKQVEVWLK